MRSRLLLSVAHLPTIRETSEEMLPGVPGEEPPASPSLDDYVRSICQLAQPTSVLDEAAARARPSRPHRPARSCEKSRPTGSLRDITTRFSGQQPALPGASPADPLDWLFGESQEKRPNSELPARNTGKGPQTAILRSEHSLLPVLYPDVGISRKPSTRQHPLLQHQQHLPQAFQRRACLFGCSQEKRSVGLERSKQGQQGTWATGRKPEGSLGVDAVF
ncbi:protein DEPP [Camelus ferus]|nr:protein DEPP [Camelus ferus]